MNGSKPVVKRASSITPKWRVLTSQVVPRSMTFLQSRETQRGRILPYVVTTMAVVGLTFIFRQATSEFTLVNIALLYLLPVLIAAVRWGLWPSFYAAGIGVVAFDFFFIPPLLTFTVADARYIISFLVYLSVATFTASLANQLRQRVEEAREREAVTSALYSLSTQVAAARDLDTVLQEIVRQASITFGLSAAIVIPDATGKLTVRAHNDLNTSVGAEVVEPRILQWVYEHGQLAGYGTSTHRQTSLLYAPLKTESTVHGVMCVQTEQREMGTLTNRMRIVEALAGLAAVSIARVRFEEEAKLAHLTAESERVRTALLDSISHELRTPLATIIGASSGMVESGNLLSEQDRRELLLTIREGAMRMNRLITNLLGMVRLESGMLRLNKQWCDVSDIVGVALREVRDSLQNRPVHVNLQTGLPAIMVDDVLIEQALVNLLSNAIKYSADGSPIYIDGLEYDGVLTLQIRDKGIGIRPDETERIFQKFFRSDAAKKIPGTGLGLAICKGVVQAHGGEIFARPAEEGGTVVTIRLPVGQSEELHD